MTADTLPNDGESSPLEQERSPFNAGQDTEFTEQIHQPPPPAASSTEQVILGVLVVGAVAVLLVKLSKRSLRWDIRQYYAINRHHWCHTGLFTQPSHCSMCETVIVASDGAFCDCCGICTDNDECIVNADKKLPCKPMTTPGADNTIHHWVKGNLPLSGCECSVCGRDCGEGVGLQDYQCTWCDRTVHTECRSSISEACDLGSVRQFVVPPHCVQLSRARLRRGLAVRRVTPPRETRPWWPVIVIGNVSSGSSEAASVLSAFRRVLNPVQVVDVSTVTVEEAVRWCRILHDRITRSRSRGGAGRSSSEERHPGASAEGESTARTAADPKKPANGVKLIVAGGDGTIGWVLNTLHKKKLMQCVEVALVPLGTGNDLSRVLGWGPALDAPLDASRFLQRLLESTPTTLDRWQLLYTPAPALHHINILPSVLPTRQVFMNNYLSIGVDAQVTLRFHQARQSPFYLFNSRLINKLIYFGYGTVDVLEHSCERLQDKLKVVMDGRVVSLPPMEALVVLNIPSWGAGVRPWTMGAGGKVAPAEAMDDGQLEVFCLSSSFHICQLQMGLSEPTRLGQCRHLQVTVSESAVPMQVDGEPWEQQPGTLTISYSHTATMLVAAPQ